MKSQPVRTLVCLALAAVLWLPALHLFFRPPRDPAEEMHALARRQAALWKQQANLSREQEAMRRTNAEWDFMSRTYFALALANLALREPAQRDRHLADLDAVIDDTLKLEREHGQLFFLMDYARDGRFIHPRGRSIFEDGEIALMLAARRLVQEKEAYREPLRERIAFMEESMRAGPVLCAESYPDECWLFCNTVALAAMRCADVLEGTDHGPWFRAWVEKAKEKLIEPKSGLLVSSFDLKGNVQDGPEGSSIWMITHCLQIVDPALAQQQYDLARRQLGRRLLGFGFAREWPESGMARVDVDSGPVIPVLEASPSSSGLALLGAASFGDTAFLNALRTSLNFGGFPQRGEEGLKYCGSNQVGDAVLLYALAQGPLWAEVERRAVR
jgi:hypothetical protein